MATPFDITKYMMNRLKIDKPTKAHLVRLVYNLLEGTCRVKLEYNMEECYKALSDQLDWKNLEGDRCPFDMNKPLSLKGRSGRLTVPLEYFLNNDLEYLKSSDPEKKYTTSITKTKVARYELVGIEDMNPNLWSATKKILSVVRVKINKLHGYGYLEEIVMRRTDRQLYKFKEGDFINLHLKDIEDMLLLTVQHKLFQLDGSDIVDFVVALRMFTRSLIIKRHVEDVQHGVESNQKKLNLTKHQQDFPKIFAKELYTPSFDLPGAVYEDLNKRILGYNDEMSRRKWSAIDKRRSELMVELIDK
nr:hypothetical protein [Tanacetum cinerariifolium]